MPDTLHKGNVSILLGARNALGAPTGERAGPRHFATIRWCGERNEANSFQDTYEVGKFATRYGCECASLVAHKDCTIERVHLRHFDTCLGCRLRCRQRA